MRVWAPDAADGTAADDVAPLTFGGLARGGPCAGCQAASCLLPPIDRDTDDEAALPSVLVIADAAASVISWRLDGIGAEALGVDSQRARRTTPLGGRAVLCLALRPGGDGGGAPALACGCADGTVAVMRMVSAGGGREAPAWGRPTELATSDGAAVVQLAWAGGAVYAATQAGEVCAQDFA